MSRKYTSLLALGTARIWIRSAHRMCAMADECQAPTAVKEAAAQELGLADKTYERLLQIHIELQGMVKTDRALKRKGNEE
jgi:hypothetical protein